MLKRRIIPCLDVKDGRTVKGINFVDLRDAGDPVEQGALYAQMGADELVYLDIAATNENRETLRDLVKEVARNVDIPFTVGGGINSISSVSPLLESGADKVAINSAAVRNPGVINELVAEFGSQCIVCAIDARLTDQGWKVHTHGGSKATDIDLFEWGKEVESRGAGEILFTSMDHDGTKNGFALQALNQLNSVVNLPVIASGGAGSKEHFEEVFTNTPSTGALAASVFHFNEISIPELKEYLLQKNIAIRS